MTERALVEALGVLPEAQLDSTITLAGGVDSLATVTPHFSTMSRHSRLQQDQRLVRKTGANHLFPRVQDHIIRHVLI